MHKKKTIFSAFLESCGMKPSQHDGPLEKEPYASKIGEAETWMLQMAALDGMFIEKKGYDDLFENAVNGILFDDDKISLTGEDALRYSNLRAGVREAASAGWPVYKPELDYQELTLNFDDPCAKFSTVASVLRFWQRHLPEGYTVKAEVDDRTITLNEPVVLVQTSIHKFTPTRWSEPQDNGAYRFRQALDNNYHWYEDIRNATIYLAPYPHIHTLI